MNFLADTEAARGQTILDYTVLIVIMIAALLGMQIYLKRGVSGRLRSAADSLGGQYAPKHTTSTFTQTTSTRATTVSQLLKDQQIAGDKVDVIDTVTTINNNTTSRTGTETVDKLNDNLWE